VGSNKPEARGLARARAAGVETGVFRRADYPDRGARDVSLAAWLDEHQVELVVLAGFMEVLSDGFIRHFSRRIVNVHPSLLPSFPGLDAVGQALAHGVRVTGVTVHFVDEGIDTGPIVLQEALDLPYAAGIPEVEERIHAIEHQLYPKAILMLARGTVRFDPDNPRKVLIDDVSN
jgi:phosphoribosylglycinamide formyltransferase-1